MDILITIVKFPYFPNFPKSVRKVISFQILQSIFNSLSANPTKYSNALKQFVGNSRRIVLSVLEHFVRLAPKGGNKHGILQGQLQYANKIALFTLMLCLQHA